MRFFIVAFVLSAAPCLAQSLPGQQASKLVLLAGESGDPGVKTALPPPPPAIRLEPAGDPFAPIYQRMVTNQLQLLEVVKVSLAGPLTITLIGGTGLVVGITSLALGALSYSFFIVGLIVLAGSALPLLIGLPWLIGSMNTNARITVEIDKLKREQRQLDSRPMRDGAVLGTF